MKIEIKKDVEKVLDINDEKPNPILDGEIIIEKHDGKIEFTLNQQGGDCLAIILSKKEVKLLIDCLKTTL